MLHIIGLFLDTILRLFRTRRTLLLENLALRQQLDVLKRKHPRPRLTRFDKLFWVIAKMMWSRWKQALIVVSPETVVRWHRAGFRMLSLAKTLAASVFNNLASCHSQAICDTTQPCYTLWDYF
jgi:hypothetical protein